MTQRDIIDRHIAYLDAQQITVSAHRYALTQWAAWLEEQGVTDPVRADVIAYRGHLTVSYMPTTAAAYMTAVRMLYRWAAAECLYPDISADVRGVRTSATTRRDALTADQVRAVLAVLRDREDSEESRRDLAMFAALCTLGLRSCEVVRADCRHLRTLAGQTVLYVRGKGHSEFDSFVPVPTETERLLRHYLTVRADAGDDDAPLFASCSHRNTGGRMSRESVSRIIKAAMRDADIVSDRLTCHSTRHFFVTQSLLSGESLQAASEAARHSSVSVTQRYAHNLSRAANQCSRAVAGAIF